MFKKNVSLTSVIGESTIVNGDIDSKDIKIDGVVNGNIKAGHTVFITKSGTVNGNIICINGNVIVEGKLIGSTNTNKFRISNTGSVEGDILTKYLSVDNGASVNSKITMELSKEETKK